jgi:hypothetical protein
MFDNTQIQKEVYLDENYFEFEREFFESFPEILDILLKDQSTKKNIIWATSEYANFGENYRAESFIDKKLIIHKDYYFIKARVLKTKSSMKNRAKFYAEVFTPLWACNHQINLIDNKWFGKKNTFNFEKRISWISNLEKIKFDKKNWEDYVIDKRLEISCGEAPYIVSRYDTVSGLIIEIKSRIGIIDRKLRVINENLDGELEWLDWAKKAFQSTYAFELQGDNLLIARQNLLFSFMEYFKDKFNKMPSLNVIKEIANIISWNIWQMDGIKCVVPLSCNADHNSKKNLFGETISDECFGCKSQNIFLHQGIYCKIKDWDADRIEDYIDDLVHGGL